MNKMDKEEIDKLIDNGTLYKKYEQMYYLAAVKQPRCYNLKKYLT